MRRSNSTAEDLATAIIAAIRTPHSNWPGLIDFEKPDIGSAALGSLFTRLHNPQVSDDEIAGCGYAVYGWMPCMLKKGVKVAVARDVIKNGVQSDTVAFVNNSWVGTSKFCYFLRPDRYFIWDSRVENAVKQQDCPFSIRFASDYLTYCDAIKRVALHRGIAALMPFAILKQNYLLPRQVEAALYAIGAPKKQNAKNRDS